jgi:MFS-type transporter involved in bile tolerance (Atg22 family)
VVSSRPGRRSELNRPLALLVAGTFFMENLDGTIIATAAPAMAADLGVGAVDINVAITTYLVTIAVGIPVSGWLTDRFGGRRVLLWAIATFTVASVLCAVSGSLGMLATCARPAGHRRREQRWPLEIVKDCAATTPQHPSRSFSQRRSAPPVRISRRVGRLHAGRARLVAARDWGICVDSVSVT